MECDQCVLVWRLVCMVVLCFPQNNIAGIHLFDDCTRSNAPSVCHKILSILWPHEQVCSQTTKKSRLPIRAKYRHFRTICEHTGQFSYWLIFLLLIDGLTGMVLRLCTFVESFHSQIRNVFADISLYNFPCRKTKKIWFLHQVSLKLLYVFFLGSSRNPGFEHIFVVCHNVITYCTISLSTTKKTWLRNDVGSSRSMSSVRIFHVGSMFSVMPAILISSTYTDKNSPLARLTNKHSQFKTFSQPCSNRTFSNCLFPQ